MDDLEESQFEREGPWVLLPEQHEKGWGQSGRYLMVWVDASPPGPNIERACKKLVTEPKVFPHFSLRLEQAPSLTLVIYSVDGFGFETLASAKKSLSKLIWEVSRLAGA